jgi:hypothetical protein
MHKMELRISEEGKERLKKFIICQTILAEENDLWEYEIEIEKHKFYHGQTLGLRTVLFVELYVEYDKKTILLGDAEVYKDKTVYLRKRFDIKKVLKEQGEENNFIQKSKYAGRPFWNEKLQKAMLFNPLYDNDDDFVVYDHQDNYYNGFLCPVDHCRCKS